MSACDSADPLVFHRVEQARDSPSDAKLLKEAGRPALGIVNRSYYAMFYAVLALLQTLGKVRRKHSGAIALFDREFVKTGVFSKELSKHLHRAFLLRQASDYEAILAVTPDEADELLADASHFLDAVVAFLGAAPGNPSR